MSINLLGISYKTAPLEIREQYSFTKTKKAEFLSWIKNAEAFKGLVLLSTCNRTEVYFEPKENFEKQSKDLLCYLLKITDEHKKYFYNKFDKDVFKHLACVVSGLDSQIIGETEIVQQVKDAYQFSLEFGLVSKLVNFVFQKSFNISKKVRSSTGIQKGCLSYGSIIFNIAKEVFNNKFENVVVVGTGEMANKVAYFFKGLKIFFVSSKYYKKAVSLARLFNGFAVKYDKLAKLLEIADIVITATSANKSLIDERYFYNTKKEKILIFDLGVPRNVSSSLKKFKNIILYSLDDLNVLRDENYKERLKQITFAEEIINSEVEKLWNKLLLKQYQNQLDLVVDLAS